MTYQSTRLGPAERAVYELVQRGVIDAAGMAALYRRPLLALARHNLVRRLDSGAYAPVSASTLPTPINGHTPRPAPPPVPNSDPAELDEPPMVSLVVRVPQEWITTLEAIGPSKSKAARAILRRALSGSGTMRKTGTDDVRS